MAHRFGGDPRRENEEEEIEVEKAASKDAPKQGDGISEMAGVISLLLGIASLVFRQRWAAWTSLVFSLISLANLRPAEADGRQMFSGIFVSIMGLVLAYRAGY